MSSGSDADLLNEHQRRHLGVTLGQIQRLLGDIGELLHAPAIRPAIVTEADDLPPEFVREAGPALADLHDRIEALATRFGLQRRERSRYRWVRSVLGLSIDNLEDARPAKMRPYGEVHPHLAKALDPGLRDLQNRLRALLALLEAPEGRS